MGYQELTARADLLNHPSGHCCGGCCSLVEVEGSAANIGNVRCCLQHSKGFVLRSNPSANLPGEGPC